MSTTQASKVTVRMRYAPRAVAGALLALLVLSLAGCGSSSRLLSSREAATLNSALDQIRVALNQRDCSAAQIEAIALKSRVAQLPSSIDGTVRSSLEQATATVERLVTRDCPRAPATPSQTTATTTTTTVTTTTAPPPAPKKKPKPHTTPATTPTQTGTTTGTSTGQGKGNGNGNGNVGGQGGGDPTTPTTSTTPTNP